MTYLFPAGAQRGQAIELTIGGAAGAWPVQVWTSDPTLTVTPAKEKGKLAVTISPDAVPGIYWIRLFSDEGATPLRPFLVGTLSEVREAEPNNSPSEPQVLESTVLIVNGTLGKSGDVDSFALELTAGQTLVASIEANRRLGSPMDAVLQIVSERGFVLEQNDEYHDVDPQIVFTAPADGRYIVRTFAFPSAPNSTIGFAGADTYVYRLTLTTEGFADHALPLAVSQDGTTEVRIEGWNLPEATGIATVERGADETASVVDPRLGNTLEVVLEPHASVIEQEPNDASQPNLLEVPLTVTGRIDPPGDVDVYRFRASKDQQVRFEIASRALGFPLDPVLRVLDNSGKELKRVDDEGGDQRDARLTFKVPEDGEYKIEVSDLHETGGFRYVYRLRAVTPQPDYALSVSADHFAVTVGKPLELPVTIDRKDGFNETLEIVAEGLPEGVTAESVTSPPEGDAAKSVKLKLSATTPTAGGPLRIVSRVAKKPEFARTATAALSDFHTRTTHLWLSVLKPEEKTDDSEDDKQ